MSIAITAEYPPPTLDKDNVLRIGETRVTLDTVVEAFQEGATAVEIAQQYSSLSLEDVYAVIAYCLRRRSDIEAYLEKRHHEATEIRRQNGLFDK
ncbi:MAG TPA: DUF433 domain-containing protein [Chthonomonadaceae bacterium]|nr:DUF433 domain-containing protein [Chthonomonadaceae bacterium]